MGYNTSEAKQFTDMASRGIGHAVNDLQFSGPYEIGRPCRVVRLGLSRRFCIRDSRIMVVAWVGGEPTTPAVLSA